MVYLKRLKSWKPNEWLPDTRVGVHSFREALLLTTDLVHRFAIYKRPIPPYNYKPRKRPMAPEKKTTRQFKKADYSVFVSAAKYLETDERDLCEVIGYSRTAQDGWRTANEIPAVVALACEALRRRKVQDKDGPRLVLLRCNSAADQNALGVLLGALAGVTVEWKERA